MLNFDPSERATAAEALNHPWLEGPPAAALAADMHSDERRSSKRGNSSAGRSDSADGKHTRYY